MSEVKSGQLNNYHYLLRLNYLGSRTFNDLNQYPIFPWLFFDISKIDALLSNEKSDIGQIETIQSTSQDSPITPEPDTENNELEKLETMNDNNEDLSERLKLRNFIYPIAMQTEERRNIYEENGHSPHGTHYSTAAYVIFYFVRNYPYGEAMIQLQNYNKENPNRLFTSMGESLNVLYENQENRESVPEFFSSFDFYCNLNCTFLGIQNNVALVDDLRVNKGLDISGNLDKDEHLQNIYPIFLRLFVFHLDISGNNNNALHPSNIWLISLTLGVSHFEISGNDFNDLHPSNI